MYLIKVREVLKLAYKYMIEFTEEEEVDLKIAVAKSKKRNIKEFVKEAIKKEIKGVK